MGRITCESCKSIDVRAWHREGKLRAGLLFSPSWICAGRPSGSIDVRTEHDAVTLMYRTRCYGEDEWKSVEQRVPIIWTKCHFGGRRPWFRCCATTDDRICGRRVAKLYKADVYFACRHCYGLVYASELEEPLFRAIRVGRKIREKLGSSTDLMDIFPDKPRGMHWRTYERLEAKAKRAEFPVLQFMIGHLPPLAMRQPLQK